MSFGKESQELGFNHAGIHAFENGDHALEHHFAANLFLAYSQPDLSRHWQKKEVGGADTVDGGDEGHGDAAAYFGGVVQVLHHLNETEHGADDSDGGRESTGGLEHFRNMRFVLGLIVELLLHHFANFLRLGAIDSEHEALFEKGIIHLFEDGIEGDDAVLASLPGVFDDFGDKQLRIF